MNPKRPVKRDVARTRLLGYRCPKCKGKAAAVNGRVRVSHQMSCEIFQYLVLSHPALYRTLEEYRKQPA